MKKISADNNSREEFDPKTPIKITFEEDGKEYYIIIVSERMTKAMHEIDEYFLRDAESDRERCCNI